ncbi:MAG: hypothetical protein JSS70_14695 [Bacteroidetes bacterium]|nr:hypothetical protein [Bacteroidota bacterium]
MKIILKKMQCISIESKDIIHSSSNFPIKAIVKKGFIKAIYLYANDQAGVTFDSQID